MNATSCREERNFSIKCLPARTAQQRNNGGFYLITLKLLRTNIAQFYTCNEQRESCIQLFNNGTMLAPVMKANLM